MYGPAPTASGLGAVSDVTQDTIRARLRRAGEAAGVELSDVAHPPSITLT